MQGRSSQEQVHRRQVLPAFANIQAALTVGQMNQIFALATILHNEAALLNGQAASSINLTVNGYAHVQPLLTMDIAQRLLQLSSTSHEMASTCSAFAASCGNQAASCHI